VSSIRVNIDRLVLRGFEPGARKALVDGLHSELSRVLANPAARAAWARAHRTPVLRLGGMPLEAGPDAHRNFGLRLGRAIGKGLKP
jgi:hypothetical protein